MKNLTIVFFISIFLFSSAYASNDVVFLDRSEINQLKVPDSPILNYINSNENQKSYLNEDDDISFSKEEDIDNKLIKSFYNFVDERAINNKVNKFTSSMIENIDEND